MLHNSAPDAEGLEDAHRLCIKLFALANEEHVVDPEAPLDAEAAKDAPPSLDLSGFPGVVHLGTPLRLVGSALSRPDPESYDLLPTTETTVQGALDAVQMAAKGVAIEGLKSGQPEGPYLNLYDAWLVRTSELTPMEVLDGSGIAIGEAIPIAVLEENGHVEFPCIVQALKGGARLQVHLDGNCLRIFSYNGAELTDDPAYVSIARAFGTLRHPRRGIFDCVHLPQHSTIWLMECISWDGGTTFRLPLHERLALLEGIEAGPALQVVPWRVVERPLDMYTQFSKKCVVKAMNASLDPQAHGWIIGKPKHVQVGRAVPWALCAGVGVQVPHLAEVTTAEAAFDLLDMRAAKNVPLRLWVCHKDAEGLQIHRVNGEVRVYRATYESLEAVDTAEAACYSDCSEEAAAWTLNVLREPNGDILGVDCLAEGASSLHTVPYSARLRIFQSRIAPTLDWSLSTECTALQGIEALREAVGKLQPDQKMIVRRADSLCEIPMLEVVVRTG